MPVSFYRTDRQPLSVSSSYKYESRLLFTHPVYEHQRQPGLGKDTIRKPMLDHLVDVKPLLHKESNKPNISQKLDFIPACEPDQKLSPPSAAEGPTTKATPTNEQEHTALLAKKS